MKYSAEALGLIIQELRDKAGLSQQTLSEKAHYGAGKSGAVSISRIENGHVLPGEERLKKIAKALNTDIATIEMRALELTRLSQDGSEPAGENDHLTFKKRLKKLQDNIDSRTTRVTTLAEEFNDASTRANDAFLNPFFEVAQQIDGAELPAGPATLTEDEARDPQVVADYRLEHSSAAFTSAIGGAAGAVGGAAVGGAAAFGTFTAVSAFGTASTGAAISGLAGAAASNATLAALGGGSLAAGGGGVAGGIAMLTGIVAAPALLLGVGGVIWMARRNKQKELEQLDKVREAEVELEASAPSFDALVTALEQGAQILEHVSVHGARAQQRWIAALATERPLAWADLGEGEQDRFRELVEVASCEIAVSDTNFEAFMRQRDDELQAFAAVTESVMREARKRIEKLV